MWVSEGRGCRQVYPKLLGTAVWWCGEGTWPFECYRAFAPVVEGQGWVVLMLVEGCCVHEEW